MKEFIAYCGLDCESCEARIATINNDDHLRQKVAEEWSQLNGVTITPQMINCTGCRIEGVKTPFCESLCPIRQCALSWKIEIGKMLVRWYLPMPFKEASRNPFVTILPSGEVSLP